MRLRVNLSGMPPLRTLPAILLGFTLITSAVRAEQPPGNHGPDTLSAASGAGAADAASRWWTKAYAAGFYDTRWNGWFLQSYAQRGYDLSTNGKFSAYGIGWLTADSRSLGTGTLPVIISDNLFLLGAGLRFKPASWFWIDAQEGVAFDLIEQNGSKAVRNDFRLLATGGSGIYPEFRVHDDVRAPLSLMADCFVSAGYYSRYKNFIAYVQGRIGARALEVSRMFVDVYLRGDLALDANGDFYNNVYEIGPGLRFTPDPDWGLFLMAEYRRGGYANYSDAMQQEREKYYPATYDAFRFFLVFDRIF
jgi:hypothetical protein